MGNPSNLHIIYGAQLFELTPVDVRRKSLNQFHKSLFVSFLTQSKVNYKSTCSPVCCNMKIWST